jgi:spore coat protein U-like protein
MINRKLSALSIVVFILALAGIAGAATVTGTLPVSVNVFVTCTVTTSPVNFGSVTGEGSAVTTGSVIVNCPLDIPYYISLDAGEHYSGGYRRIASGSYSAAYELRKPDLALWGDSDYANTYPAGGSLPDTGTGVNQSHVVNATLFPFTGIPAETVLTDTVTVTVSY